ncbi:MAG: hypothetical protein V1927_06155 [Candidatus Omnitrophota bacterium]
MKAALGKFLFVGFLLCCMLFLSAWTFWNPPPEPGRATFSPDGQHLIFSMKYHGHSDIYRIKKDGTELTKLTSSPGYDFDPAYSPDGSKIVFSRIHSTKYTDPANLYIMNSDGSNVTQLTFDNMCDISPVFSPAGDRIYFIRARWFGRHSLLVSSFWQDKDIFSIRPDGSDLKAVTNESFYAMSEPSISSDGKEILISLAIYKNPDSLWLVPIINPKARRALRPNLMSYIPHGDTKQGDEAIYENIFAPHFSPNGKSFSFQWSTKNMELGYYEYELYIMDLESNKVRQLTSFRHNATSPSFSPDGKEVVFLFDPRWPKGGAPHELWIVNSDGTNLHRVNIDMKGLAK